LKIAGLRGIEIRVVIGLNGCEILSDDRRTGVEREYHVYTAVFRGVVVGHRADQVSVSQ
jgi:hypothetical protein